MTALHLRRIDPARNMRRFYRLDIEPDLFGGFLLMKEWGRIGSRGRIVAESYDSADLAVVAMQRQAERKRRPRPNSRVTRRQIDSEPIWR